MSGGLRKAKVVATHLAGSQQCFLERLVILVLWKIQFYAKMLAKLLVGG